MKTRDKARKPVEINAEKIIKELKQYGTFTIGDERLEFDVHQDYEHLVRFIHIGIKWSDTDFDRFLYICCSIFNKYRSPFIDLINRKYNKSLI